MKRLLMVVGFMVALIGAAQACPDGMLQMRDGCEQKQAVLDRLPVCQLPDCIMMNGDRYERFVLDFTDPYSHAKDCRRCITKNGAETECRPC